MLVYKVKNWREGEHEYFTPNGKTFEENDPLSLRRVATLLGTKPAVVRQLVEAGQLEGEDDPETGGVVVLGGSLQKFIGKLQPVELIEQPALPAAAPGRGVERGPQPSGVRANPDPRTLQPVVEASPASNLEPDDDGGYDYTAACPHCGALIGLTDGVLRVKCPNCAAILECEAEPVPAPKPVAPPAPATTRQNPLRLFGFRTGRAFGGS